MLCQALRVQGALTPEMVRKALYRLQRRHPLLRARFVEDDRYYRFQVAPIGEEGQGGEIPEVPLRVVSRQNGSQWEEIMEDEFSRDFSPESQALWRTIFVHSEDPCDDHELINLFHHSLSDGASTARFAQELLSFCGRIAERADDVMDEVTLPLLPPAEQMVAERSSSSKPGDRSSPNPASERRQKPWAFEAHKPLNERKARSLYFQIDEGNMTNLKARCQDENTTVSSALAAALLLSTCKKTDSVQHVPFSFAMDLRGYCEPELTHEHFGCYIMMEQAVLAMHEGVPFWDLARHCGQELSHRVDVRRKQGFLPKEFHRSFLRSMVEGNMAEADARQVFHGGPCLSNLGVLDLSEAYGPLRLKEIYFGSPHLSGLYSVFLCTAALHGKLFCALHYTEPLLSRDTARSIADAFVAQVETKGSAR
jgi:NRPS condensation-like uncharacterized protein